MNEALQEKSFEIRLPQFEGPFDLLLFFIERDELDIHNIHISQITNDFLEYIHQLNELNLEVASEFILVAATLMRIKAKMLLPRPEIDEQGNEIDPRQSLVVQLLAYKRFKAAAEEMKWLEEQRSMSERRGNITKELTKILQNTTYADELNSISLYKLMETYEKVMSRFIKDMSKPVHTVVQLPYTIVAEKENIQARLRQSNKLAFIDVLQECKDRYHLIFTFMAILELLAEQLISITLGLGFNNFWISPVTEE